MQGGFSNEKNSFEIMMIINVLNDYMSKMQKVSPTSNQSI